jgi:hypothetical protein
MFARKISVRVAAVIAAVVVSLSGVAQAAWARPIILPPNDGTHGPIILPPKQ